MEKVVSFNGNLRFLETKRIKLQQPVEVWLLNDGLNENGEKFENLDEHKKLFAETPILVAYVGRKIGDGHNMEEVRTPDGEIAASFMDATAERIVGFFKSADDVRMEEKDGLRWIVAKGFIWKWYAQELIAKLQRQGFEGMSVSIEAIVYSERKEEETGITINTKYDILGTTILGDDVEPAYTEANIRLLAAIGCEGMKKLTRLKVAAVQKGDPQKKEERKKPMTEKDFLASLTDCRILSRNGNCAFCVNADGKTIIARESKTEENTVERAEISACAEFSDGDDEFTVSVSEIVENAEKALAELNAKLTDEAEKREAAESALATMRDAERKAAVERAIEQRICEIAEKTGKTFEAALFESLKTEESIAYYVSREADGEFCGAREACDAVDAICMKELLKTEAAEEHEKKTVCSWNDGQKDHEDKGDETAFDRI